MIAYFQIVKNDRFVPVRHPRSILWDRMFPRRLENHRKSPLCGGDRARFGRRNCRLFVNVRRCWMSRRMSERLGRNRNVFCVGEPFSVVQRTWKRYENRARHRGVRLRDSRPSFGRSRRNCRGIHFAVPFLKRPCAPVFQFRFGGGDGFADCRRRSENLRRRSRRPPEPILRYARAIGPPRRGAFRRSPAFRIGAIECRSSPRLSLRCRSEWKNRFRDE